MIGAVAVLAVGLAGGIGVAFLLDHDAGTARISSADILSMTPQLFPEGTNPPPLLRGAPGARDIYSQLPLQLSRPAQQQLGCTPARMTMFVDMRNGEHFTYGPCHLPNALERVGALMYNPQPRIPITAVHFRPFPKGPVVDTYVGSPGFDELVGPLPWPLPFAQAEPASCPAGITIEIDTVDGGRVTYGPCNRPIDIDSLRTRIVPS
jgi:hypothetical protein